MHTTSTGKIKVGIALDPYAYELLTQMAAGPRAVGALLGSLICAEAARRESVERDQNSDQELYEAEIRRRYERAEDEITERRQVEMQLTAAAELEATFASIADGVVLYDGDGKIARMNATARDILGYSPAEQELPMSERVGWLSAVPADGEYGGPETLPVYRAQHGETVQGSVWIMTRHSADPLIPNRQRWITTSAAPIRDAEGRQIGTVASFTDVTELHRTLEALCQARDELEQRVHERTAELEVANAQLVRKEATLQYQANVLEHIHDAVIATDTNLRITAWNHGAEEQYGWKAEEVIGASVPKVVGSEMSSEQTTAANLKVLETGHWRGEVLHRRRDGTPIPTEATTIVMRDPAGPITGYVSVHRDITERRQAEEARRQQKERLEILHRIDRSILAAVAPAEIAQTAASKILQIAQAMRVTVVLTDFATQEGEILAAMGPEAAVHRAGRRVPLSGYPMIERVRAGGVAQIEDFGLLSVAELPSRDEALRAGTRSSTLVPLIAGGQVIGLLSISRSTPGRLPDDLLEMAIHVADSLALAIHNARLHDKIQAGQAQLQALSRRLVESQERERAYVADRLLNDAAQVLAALKLQMGLLDREMKRLPESADYLDQMTEKMDLVLRELHHLASSLRPAVLDRLGLASALHQYLDEFGRQHGLAVECMTMDVAHVRLPREVETALFRMVQQAMANVAQHARASHVDLALARAGTRLRLSIQDDGVGFDVQETLRRGALGLVDMRERAEALGGKLDIDSAAGSGTTIIVEVPFDITAAAV